MFDDDLADFFIAVILGLLVAFLVALWLSVIFDYERDCQEFSEEYNVVTVYENDECFVEENGQRFILEQYKYNKLQGVVPSPSIVPSVAPSN